MRTKNQIRANRANAKKSTGPRTQEGKARSSQNALKHGLLANDAVLPGEDPADFDRHLRSFEDTYLPRNRVEKEIVRQIADVAWRMQRLSRIETAVIAVGIDNTRRVNLETGPIPDDRAGQTQQLGRAMLTRTQVLNNLARYDGQLARRFFRGVELMINIRREDRQLREAYEAKNAGATTPLHYLPDEDPSSAHPSAIGFRPAEKIGDCPKRRRKDFGRIQNHHRREADCPPFFRRPPIREPPEPKNAKRSQDRRNASLYNKFTSKKEHQKPPLARTVSGSPGAQSPRNRDLKLQGGPKKGTNHRPATNRRHRPPTIG